MTILYLHGLDSKLNTDKRAVLENFGSVIAPDMNYYDNPNVFEMLLQLNEEHKFDVVIGSSMGGFMSYHIANTLNCPALLFNPAMQQNKVQQNIPTLNLSNASSLLHFALGGKDETVSANSILKWLSENRLPNTDYKISIHKDLEHNIIPHIFKLEVTEFFRQCEMRK